MQDCFWARVVTLDGEVSLEDLVAVARYGAEVKLGETFRDRTLKSRAVVERLNSEGRRMYGVNTGLGENVKRAIPEEEIAGYQEKILLSHCVSVGEPLDEEAVRAVMFVMLTNMGSGFSGVRLETLEHIANVLNKGVVPWAPAHGSVGYLAIEAHISLVLIGKGKAWFKGELMDGGEALKLAGITPISLSYKEGLSLVNGCTSVTALGVLAAHDALNLVDTADVIASCSIEALGGNLVSYSEKAMEAKRQPEQRETAVRLRGILRDSGILGVTGGKNLQDALSLRCIPQAHGAARRAISDAVAVMKNEINSCNDNPIAHPSGEVISACNADAGYVGIESDSLCVASAYLAKISERRTDRMVNEHVSGLPPFLSESPGSNSGFMIIQYASAGLVAEIRMLSHPASVDSIPTCALQEDYVSMGYNAALKARKVVSLAEYVLGNELLTAVQALEFRAKSGLKMSPITEKVAAIVRKRAPFMANDQYISPSLEWARELVHFGRVSAVITDF